MFISQPDTSRPPSDISIAHDKLEGVAAIAAEIGCSPRRTHYLLERKMLPAGKVGAIWVASRTTLRAHFSRLTAGVAA